MNVRKTATQEHLVRLAETAGKIILKSDKTSTKKPDGSDITQADWASHNFLMRELRALAGPNVSILSEESAADDIVNQTGTQIIIDPLDGTTNFKNGSRNFAVLLAVLEEGVPVYGVAVLPAYGVTLCGGTAAGGAEVRTWDKKADAEQAGGKYKLVRSLPTHENSGKITLVPQRFMRGDKDDVMQAKKVMERFNSFAQNTSFGTSGKILGTLLPVLSKSVHSRLYEAFKPVQRPGDWDIAAWDAILRARGGKITTMEGRDIRYGAAEKEFKHQGFISWRHATEAGTYARQYAAQPEGGGNPSP